MTSLWGLWDDEPPLSGLLLGIGDEDQQVGWESQEHQVRPAIWERRFAGAKTPITHRCYGSKGSLRQHVCLYWAVSRRTFVAKCQAIVAETSFWRVERWVNSRKNKCLSLWEVLALPEKWLTLPQLAQPSSKTLSLSHWTAFLSRFVNGSPLVPFAFSRNDWHLPKRGTKTCLVRKASRFKLEAMMMVRHRWLEPKLQGVLKML